MQNVKTEVKGDKLFIEVDISEKAIKAAPMSSTGKSKLVGSTKGYVAINDGMRLMVNVIR